MAEWNTPKTDWVTNPKNPVAEDFNRIEGNIAFLKGDIETKKGAIVNALNTVGLETQLTDTHAQIANKIVAANQGTKIYTPSTVNQPIPKGFHSGQGYVIGDSDLKASNIRKGVTIFGVTGNLEEGSPVISGTDFILYESTRYHTVYASSYTLYEGVTLKVYGTVRVYVRVFAWGYKGDTGDFQIRRNGGTVASGTVTCNTPVPPTSGYSDISILSQNITVSKGDSIQLYFKWNGVVMADLPPGGRTGMRLETLGDFAICVSRSSFIY